MIVTTTSQLEEIPDGDLIELRVDLLKEMDIKALQSYRKRVMNPLILTYRGGDQEIIAKLNPDYIDLDASLPKEEILRLQTSYPGIKWILSFHDFERMPDDLEGLYQSLSTCPASYYKMALFAHSPLDTLRLLNWLKASGRKNVIAIPMGLHGTFGRILTVYTGSPFTYACHEAPVAPGQLTYAEMKRFLHSKKAGFYGLIGDPVTQSPSHITHNALMGREGIEGVYVKVQLTPAEVPNFLEGAKAVGFKGLSVTMPLKEVIIPYLDTLTDKAKAIGAVNTVAFTEMGLLGENTDGEGALGSLDLKDQTVVVLGAGGAARALIYIALQKGAQVILAARLSEKGTKLAEAFKIPLISLESVGTIAYDLLINATPSPLPIPASAIRPGSHVMETKIDPAETELLIEAKKLGCTISYGIEMFFGQAALQFALWFKFNEISPQSTQRTLRNMRNIIF
jgi:3-dehydroquinate dehydratase/shikimate dehydrogenase